MHQIKCGQPRETNDGTVMIPGSWWYLVPGPRYRYQVVDIMYSDPIDTLDRGTRYQLPGTGIRQEAERNTGTVCSAGGAPEQAEAHDITHGVNLYVSVPGTRYV